MRPKILQQRLEVRPRNAVDGSRGASLVRSGIAQLAQMGRLLYQRANKVQSEEGNAAREDVIDRGGRRILQQIGTDIDPQDHHNDRNPFSPCAGRPPSFHRRGIQPIAHV